MPFYFLGSLVGLVQKFCNDNDAQVILMYVNFWARVRVILYVSLYLFYPSLFLPFSP
jgi:hypothetical protein